jgi:hypothetical protein
MSFETAFQMLEAVAVAIGVAFAIVQIRQFNEVRRRDAALELLHSFQTPTFAKALVLTYALPNGLTKEEIEQRLGDDFHLVYAMTTTWESLGILVYRREVPLDMVCDFFSGPIMVSWERLGAHFAAERKRIGRETIGEWFQWLRDRVAEAEEGTAPIPAHVEHRHWKPKAEAVRARR